MPRHNHFQHQNYPTTPASTPEFRTVRVTDGQGINFLQLHQRSRIAKVIVVPGTFGGDDPLAIAAMLREASSKDSPVRSTLEKLSSGLRKTTQAISETLRNDVAAYTDGFISKFQKLVGDDPSVEMLSPTWSSQNNHLARAELAINLLLQLDRMQPTEDRRILLWGHSHAGNGFAILSNLLANHRPSVERFFEAANQTSEDWVRARQILKAAASPHPWASCLHLVCFGTPVRYGWDCDGYRSLLHLLHHRTQPSSKSIQTFPLYPPHSLADTISAKYGDWIQAFAIAGTDMVPSALEESDQRLAKVLEAGLAPAVIDEELRQKTMPDRLRQACARWKSGTRCHSDGQQLLIKYEPCGRTTTLGNPIENARFGHGVATTIDWLPTHLALTMEKLAAEF